jgi:ATP synthase F1 complex assembly factor 2
MFQSTCSAFLLQGLARASRRSSSQLHTSCSNPSLHTSIKKRFYKNVSIVQSEGAWEVNLDQRKLKTPLGNPLKIQNEFMAHAVANEWRSQKEVILLSQMHMNGLVNTCLDNPQRLDKPKLVKQILDFLETDTILFHCVEPPELLELQAQKWNPVLLWFRERFNVHLDPVAGISAPTVSPADMAKLEKHFMSHSLEALNGFMFGVDATKSLILTLACIERVINVEEAVRLARLELLFQTDHWGSVEWAHDIEEFDTTARLAAATLFVQLSSSQTSTRAKQIQM